MKVTWEWCLNVKGITFDEKTKSDIKSLVEIYKCKSENHAFFYWLKNEVGKDLKSLDEEYPDALAWLQIKERSENADWYLYEFEEHDDYQMWKQIKELILPNLNSDRKKLMQMLEDFCINAVTDKN